MHKLFMLFLGSLIVETFQFISTKQCFDLKTHFRIGNLARSACHEIWFENGNNGLLLTGVFM
jgi:hypothetical protein